MSWIICHYHEIALKGGNRKFFEEQLVRNIKNALKPAFFEFVRRISGRIIIKLTKIGETEEKEIKESLKNVFSLAYFAFADSSEQKIEEIKKKALELLKNKKFTPLRDKSLTGFRTFRISAQRSEKKFHLTSQEINEKIGKEICQKLKKQVDLENPDITCFIEIVENFAFLYTEKIKGPGGLPVGVSGKAVVLLSGGIDSPVAAFYVMKRGVKAIFVHFHSYPYTNKSSIEKVEKLISVLNKFQFNSKLYSVPFGDIQKEILLKTPAKLRVILYRRFMFRIAREIAEKEKALALVTGESIGQVASQTLENIRVVEEAVDLPVFRPLLGFDKEEIINKAKEIGTYEISILPYQDCCVRFLPVHPETKAKLPEVKSTEKKLNIKKLLKETAKDSSIEII